MPKGAYTLSDIDWPMIRLYCPACHRFAPSSLSWQVDPVRPESLVCSLAHFL
jgi:hypothetical protein